MTSISRRSFHAELGQQQPGLVAIARDLGVVEQQGFATAFARRSLIGRTRA